MAKMIISFSDGMYRATNTFDTYPSLKRQGWKFAWEGKTKYQPHWYVRDKSAVEKFTDFLDDIAHAEYHGTPIAKKQEFQPTEEQLNAAKYAKMLLDGKIEHNHLKVVAGAGTGKTTTLQYLSRGVFSREQIFYAVFNTKNAIEAQEKFPFNVTATTVHSFAWRALDLKPNEDMNGVKLHHIVRNHFSEQPDWHWLNTDTVAPIATQAAMIAAVITQFCASADVEISQSHVDFVLSSRIGQARQEIQEALDDGRIDLGKYAERMEHIDKIEDAYRTILLPGAREIWDLVSDRSGKYLPACHDVYQKLFELDDELIAASFKPYSILLIDEAQDLNPVQLSIFQKTGLKRVSVGDNYQGIYAFRGSISALRAPGFSIPLSQSWRFGQLISSVAAGALSSHPEPPQFKVSGNPARNGLISVYQNGLSNPVDILNAQTGTRAILCRTNAGIISVALEFAALRQQFSVVGGLRAISDDVRAVDLLHRGKELPSRSKFRKYADFSALEAEAVEDRELQALVELVKGGKVKLLMEAEKYHVTSGSGTFIEVSTVHKAKGMEWDNVLLHSDFSNIDKMSSLYYTACKSRNSYRIASAIESWHVLYVAITRVKSHLIIPENIKQILVVTATKYGDDDFVYPHAMIGQTEHLIVRIVAEKEKQKEASEETKKQDKPKKKRKPKKTAITENVATLQ